MFRKSAIKVLFFSFLSNLIISFSVERLVYRMIENEQSNITLRSAVLKDWEQFGIPSNGTVDYFVRMIKLKRVFSQLE